LVFDLGANEFSKVISDLEAVLLKYPVRGQS
jgi:hypothetical protein